MGLGKLGGVGRGVIQLDFHSVGNVFFNSDEFAELTAKREKENRNLDRYFVIYNTCKIEYPPFEKMLY